jgi:hypothetical protein
MLVDSDFPLLQDTLQPCMKRVIEFLGCFDTCLALAAHLLVAPVFWARLDSSCCGENHESVAASANHACDAVLPSGAAR